MQKKKRSKSVGKNKSRYASVTKMQNSKDQRLEVKKSGDRCAAADASRTGTEAASALSEDELKAKYDLQARSILSPKVILAWIVKYCVTLLKSYTIEEITNRIDERPSEIGSSGTKSASHSRIFGLQDKIAAGEGHYVEPDVLFTIHDAAGAVGNGLLVNVDLQNSDSPGYEIASRAKFYTSALTVWQKGRTFENSDYNSYLKVYSIWIMTKPKAPARNEIVRLHTIRQSSLSDQLECPNIFEDRDEIVLIYLGGPQYPGFNKLIRLLYTLFSGKVSLSEQKRILEEDYKIPMTEELDKELATMCNLSEGIWNEAMQQGRSEGLKRGRSEGLKRGRSKGLKRGRSEGKKEQMLHSVHSLMKNQHMSIQEAMDALDISGADRQFVLGKLEKKPLAA